MKSAQAKTSTQERERRVMSGWPMLVVTIALYVATPVLIWIAFAEGTTTSSNAASTRLTPSNASTLPSTSWTNANAG